MAGWLLSLPLLLTLAEGVHAGPFGEVQLIGEPLIYRSRLSASEPFIVYTDTVTLVERGSLYRVELAEETGRKTVALVQAKDWRPLQVQVFDPAGQRIDQIQYNGDAVIFDLSSRNLSKTIKLGGDYYDCNTLYHFLRAFPFGKGRKVTFNLVMDGRGGSKAGPIAMYVQERGRTTVKVEAGTFEAYELEMGVSGLLGLFAGKYRYYFWYTAEAPHYLLKYRDKEGGAVTELIRPGK
ncbi:MAG TPA: DUF3108 domain-containing protein [Firmicutes bacterium]|nr:DUF3108 domain-containing protein [Bacillota bacterium]